MQSFPEEGMVTAPSHLPDAKATLFLYYKRKQNNYISCLSKAKKHISIPRHSHTEKNTKGLCFSGKVL
jgi:hypothetical protein